LTSFAQAWDRLQPDFDRILGEQFLFAPRQPVKNATSIADPNRSQYIVTGIKVEDDIEVMPGGQNAHIETALRYTFLSIQFPQGIFSGDQVQRLKDGKLFEITDVRIEAMVRTLVHVKEIPPS